MKTVLLSFYHLGLGGIQTKIIDLANDLVKNGNRVIVLLSEKKEFDRSDELDKRVLVFYTPKLFPALIKRRYTYHLIITWLFFRPKVIVLSQEGIPLIFLKLQRLFPFVGSEIIVNMDTHLKFEQQKSVHEIAYYFSFAKKVVAVSLDTYSDLIGRVGLDEKKVLYLPNWTNALSRINYEKNNNILFAGRFDLQKRPLLALKFFNLVSRKNKKISMTLYGEGAFQNEMERFIKTHHLEKRVRMNGPSHEILSIAEQFSFVLSTSLYEGLPFFLLEAMMRGCVPLALDCPGVRELIIDGKTGLIDENIESLAARFLKLTPREIAQISNAAQDHVRRNYSSLKRKKYIDLIQS